MKSRGSSTAQRLSTIRVATNVPINRRQKTSNTASEEAYRELAAIFNPQLMEVSSVITVQRSAVEVFLTSHTCGKPAENSTDSCVEARNTLLSLAPDSRFLPERVGSSVLSTGMRLAVLGGEEYRVQRL